LYSRLGTLPHMNTQTVGARIAEIDASHSSAHFSVRHLMISQVRGGFNTLSGRITLGESGAIPTAVEVSIDAASIDTAQAQRDEHLRSGDFLDVERFPKITFTSTAITLIDATSFDVAGTLEIHGVQRPITARTNVTGECRDPVGNDRIGYETAFKINRKEFGIAYHQLLESGGIVVGDQVEITLFVESLPKPP
jgi:polyisoprenoid-binding protein YceI